MSDSFTAGQLKLAFTELGWVEIIVLDPSDGVKDSSIRIAVDELPDLRYLIKRAEAELEKRRKE